MRLLFTLIVTAALAYGIGAWLCIAANPEVEFWCEVEDSRELGIAEVRGNQPGTPTIFFAGGSSTAFSIDPKIIEEACGLPTFNLGLPIASGADYIIHQALLKARANDVLVICIEPDMLLFDLDQGLKGITKLSFALAARKGHPWEAAGGETFGQYPSFGDTFRYSRPGAGQLVTHLGRIAIRKPYRYDLGDLRYRGRIETDSSGGLPAGPRTGHCLTPYGRRLLRMSAEAGEGLGIRLVYALPWHYVTEEAVEESRVHRARLLEDIQTVMPVIDDGFLGVASDPDWFSDSALHLSAAGSSARSHALAASLCAWLQQAPNH